ncbi:sugar O-acyltransferase, sialic acid O-acetyltransferase NeuD family [Cyclobacterium xiamenense]|uniref:Sugar O-acyltransferase, sialic acid O-acetyltransferase NeuD family n=1 Tax=Cyclobacterium xiamenense TaxID=1297121 RepID=A0A1H6YUN2_9BACT|nr:acetyltransferase [Cyclobacterium xiamenense]SEJ40515.1 sugar O-acyltransferase, sialic acid O-acetyltransferase NeuD family [Cyclobacterium xiamenense]
MSEAKSVFLFGYSGHSYVIIESLLDAGYVIGGYFDFQRAERNPYELEYFGYEGEVDVKTIVGNDLVFPSIGENPIRRKLVDIFEHHRLNQFVAIDPSAQVSKTASLNYSTYIGKNVVVNAQSEIGKGVILNTSCIVEHECEVSDYAHIAPGAVLSGNVYVGTESFVGANAVVRQNVRITSGNVIGAGSVVLSDVEEKGIWVGNKLRKL